MNLLSSRERIAALTAVVLASGLLIISFYKTDVEVYLFPRIAAVIIAILASLLVIDTLNQSPQKTLNQPNLFEWKTLLPGLGVGVVYVLSLEALGFYFCSFIAYFLICSIYGKRGIYDLKAVMFKLMVTTIFMTALYVLFWKLLHVRTPTGLFI